MRSSNYCRLLFAIILSLSLNSAAQFDDAIASLGYVWLGDRVNVIAKKAGKHLISPKEFNLTSPVLKQIISLGTKTWINGIVKETLADPSADGLVSILSSFTIASIPQLLFPSASPQIYVSKTLENALKFIEKGGTSPELLAELKEIAKLPATAEEFEKVLDNALLSLTDKFQKVPKYQETIKQLEKAASIAGNRAAIRLAAFNAGLKLNSIVEHVIRIDDFIFDYDTVKFAALNSTFASPDRNDYRFTARERLIRLAEIAQEDPLTASVAVAHCLLSHGIVLFTQILGNTGVRQTNVALLEPKTSTYGKLLSIAFSMFISYGIEDYAKNILRDGFDELDLYDPKYVKAYDAAYVVGVKAPFAVAAWQACYTFAKVLSKGLLVQAHLLDFEKHTDVKEAITGGITLAIFTLLYVNIEFNEILWDSVFSTLRGIKYLATNPKECVTVYGGAALDVAADGIDSVMSLVGAKEDEQKDEL